MDHVLHPSTMSKAELAKVYAKAWLDDDFRRRLEADPTAALRDFAQENGLGAAGLGDADLQEVLKGNAAHLHPPPACC